MDGPFPTWVLWVFAGTAAAAGAVVLLIGLMRRGRGPRPNLERFSALKERLGISAGRESKPVAFMPPPAALAADPSAVDHRANYRRPGNPVLVLITDAEEPDRTFQAWVVDRSRRGLRLAVQHAVEVGRMYTVRPVNAPPAAPWTPLEVRHCTAQDNYWDVGGRFPEPPPMQVVVLFG